MKDLFNSIVKENKHTEIYRHIRDNNVFLPVKMMIQDVFNTFDDVDGNFIEQFQSTGFDARLFELYAWACLKEAGLDVDRTHQYPDFLIKKGIQEASVEVTTATGNWSSSGDMVWKDNDPLLTRDVNSEEFQHFLRNDVPLKFSSPILSKLRKKYWLNEHCKDRPFIIFLGGFFDDSSHIYSCGSLTSILFGYEYEQDDLGRIFGKTIDYHEKSGVKIPSGLFFKPTKEWEDMDNVSAIVFSNAGTVSKFRRMGWLKGYYDAKQVISRRGIRLNTIGSEPIPFDYMLDIPPFKESWGDEMVIIHNPNAIHPLSRNYFKNYVNIWYEHGAPQMSAQKDGIYIISSMSMTECFGDVSASHPVIQRITKFDFDKHKHYSDKLRDFSELYWFKNPVNKKIGAVYLDKEDSYNSGYSYRIFSTIENAKSYKLCVESKTYKDEDDAVKELLSEMTD